MFLFSFTVFNVLFVARAFSLFLFARGYIIVLYSDVDANFVLTVIILFSLSILTFVQ